MLAYETEIIAAKRLLASKCKWYGCPVVANSPWKLRQHVQQQHANHVPRAVSCLQCQSYYKNELNKLFQQEKVFACQWGNCARRFLNLAALGQHVGNHVRKEIMCPYKGMEAQVDEFCSNQRSTSQTATNTLNIHSNYYRMLRQIT